MLELEVRALEMKCSDCGVMWDKGPTWETSVIYILSC